MFTEVARDSGVGFTLYNDAVPDRYFLPEIMGGGTAWLDYDGDGLLDLILADGCALDPASSPPREPQSRLYRNLGDGKFVDATAAGQLQTKSFGQGCAVGDYDADGFPDLFVATYGPDLLFHNQGDGTLQLVTAEAGASDDLWSSSAVWLDADQDGDLDLYVVNYMAVTLIHRSERTMTDAVTRRSLRWSRLRHLCKRPAVSASVRCSCFNWSPACGPASAEDSSGKRSIWSEGQLRSARP